MIAAGWIALAIVGLVALVALAGVAWFARKWHLTRIDLVDMTGELTLAEQEAQHEKDRRYAARLAWRADEDVLADRARRFEARGDKLAAALSSTLRDGAAERSRLLRELADMGAAVQTVARREEQAREDAALAVRLALTRLAEAEEQLTGYEAELEEADRVATLLAAAYTQEVDRRRTAQRFIESTLVDETVTVGDVSRSRTLRAVEL